MSGTLQKFRFPLTAAGFLFAGMAAAVLFRLVLSASVAPEGLAHRHAPPPLNPPPGGKATVVAMLQEFLQAGTPMQQMAAALNLAENGSASEIRALLDQSRRFPAHHAGTVAATALLKRWLELEPAEAVEYCRIHFNGLFPAVLSTWSVTSPEKAEAAILSLPPGTMRTKAWRELCLTTASTDPEKAWKLAERAALDGGEAWKLAERAALDGGEAWNGLEAVLDRLVSRDESAGMNRLQSLPPNLQDRALVAVGRELIKTDPDKAWEWMGQQPRNQEIIREALRTLFTRDPAKAISLLASAPDETQQHVLTNSYQRWSTSDMTAMAAALCRETAIPPQRREKMAATALATQDCSDPAVAQALLALIADPQTLRTAIRRQLGRLNLRGPSTGQAWIDGLTEGDLRNTAQEVDRLNRMVANTPVPDRESVEGVIADLRAGVVRGQDPRLTQVSATQFAEAFNPDSLDMENDLFEGMARLNPPAAAGWLRNQEMSLNSTRAAARFATAWAREDPAAAGAWAASLPPDGELAFIAVSNIARQYQFYAPAEAETWLNGLASGPMQDAARKAMAGP